MERLGVQAFASSDHGAGHASFAHFVHSSFALDGHAKTSHGAGRRCVLDVGTAVVQEALILAGYACLFALRVLC